MDWQSPTYIAPMRGTRIGTAFLLTIGALMQAGVAIGALAAQRLVERGVVAIDPDQFWLLDRLAVAAPWLLAAVLIQAVAVIGVLADERWGLRLGAATVAAVVVLAVAGIGLVALGHDPFAAIEASGAQRSNGLGILTFTAAMYGLAWLGLRRLAARAPFGAAPSVGASA